MLEKPFLGLENSLLFLIPLKNLISRILFLEQGLIIMYVALTQQYDTDASSAARAVLFVAQMRMCMMTMVL